VRYENKWCWDEFHLFIFMIKTVAFKRKSIEIEVVN